ncbi:hypothetical protein [Saccharothrix algeriensis]|uniref:Uncharacterized protein n=1 Tax=Saccharothrix algeriensis TaxID=173560 RepID=A0ABS2SFF9_9PSEU|nr:hypothetical protein [Saccharothrix algeriensis]MBM7813791.1 hypothetical protein [Saccharothrix algeriensis]
MNPTIRELLDTADQLLAATASSGLPSTEAATTVSAPSVMLTVTTASRCRGAAFALRVALESAVAARLTAHRAPRAIREGNMRAALLWLRGCVEAGTARRAKATWSQLCLGCHYHQYEIGPTEDQVRSWRSEVAALIALMGR